MSPAPRRLVSLSLPLLFIFIIASTDLVDSQSLPPQESKAMSDLRTNLGDAALNVSSNSDPDPCTWPTVRCTSGHVTAIYIKEKNLAGKTLPSSLSNLNQLTELHLQNNLLTGEIPTLNGFSSLQKLYLNQNNFTSVPNDCFNGMTSLQKLAIDQNPSLAAWRIPDGLSTATGLNSFTADTANINGPIPSFLGKLPSLTTLILSNNDLSGGLPDGFAGSAIQSLWLNGQKSKLSGGIGVLQNMKALNDARLNMNNFTGPLPDFSGLIALQLLWLRDNQLTGPVPESLINLPQLKNVSLGNNHLQGPEPKFSSSVTVDPNGGLNSFCTNITGGQCDPLVNTLISILKPWGYPLFFATMWTGNSPCTSSWLGITCSGNSVTRVSLNNRSLSGTISSNFSLLTSLQVLNLSNNNLTGEIPTELTRLTQLKEVDISNNNLCGQRPSFPSSVIVNVDGNPNIGQVCKSSVPPSNNGEQSASHSSNTKVILPICITIAALVVVIISGLWWWRKKQTQAI